MAKWVKVVRLAGRRNLLLLLTVSFLLVAYGCAVQRSKAPQISAKTATELNLAVQLQQANDDYVTFFKDVGKAKASGQLTDAQVASLIKIGKEMKEYLEKANAVAKSYEINHDQALAVQVANLVQQAMNIYLSLVSNRTTMLSGSQQ